MDHWRIRRECPVKKENAAFQGCPVILDQLGVMAFLAHLDSPACLVFSAKRALPEFRGSEEEMDNWDCQGRRECRAIQFPECRERQDLLAKEGMMDCLDWMDHQANLEKWPQWIFWMQAKEMENLGYQHCQGQRGKEASQDIQEHREDQGQRACQDCWAKRELLEYQGKWEEWDQEGRREWLEGQEHLDLMELPESRVQKDCLGSRDCLVHPGRPVMECQD